MKLFVLYSYCGTWGFILEGIFTTEEKAELAIKNIKADEDEYKNAYLWYEEEWTDPPELLY